MKNRIVRIRTYLILQFGVAHATGRFVLNTAKIGLILLIMAVSYLGCPKTRDYPYRIIDEIPSGDACGIIVLPNGEYIYAATAPNVSVIRASNNKIVDTIPVGGGPAFLATLPNGEYVYVTNTAPGISVIRTSDNTVVDSILLSGAWGITALPDGDYVYITSDYHDQVFVIRTSDNTVVDSIPVDPEPSGIASSVDGKYVYVANGLIGNKITW